MKAFVYAGVFMAITTTPLFGCGGSFEEAPPTLDIGLDRLPNKTLEQIFEETSPPVPTANPPPILESIKAILARVENEPAAKLITEVDQLMAVFRADGGEHEDLARLHDLRDGLSSAPSECGQYIQWRLDHTPSIKPFIQSDPYHYPPEPPLSVPAGLIAEIEKNAASSKGPMRAHWLYLRGAVYFNYKEKVEAQKWFDKVVQEFPNHPRAEIALFMSGRCLLSQSRQATTYYQELKEEIDQVEGQGKAKRAEAIERFHEYLKKYPTGRFVADTYGWLGALEPGLTSLDDYIRQVETPGHPEVLKSGIKMIQARLEDLTSNTAHGEAAVDLVAKHPRVAMATLYVVLGAAADNGPDVQPNQSNLDPPVARTKKWRSIILPRLATAVASQKAQYAPNDIWQPRYLAILAHAASNTGANADALKLTEMNPQGLEQNDDLLFARAIALQRAERASEAIAAYQTFLTRFSSSPLAPGVRVRYAIALRDDHQSGRAVLELQRYLLKQSANEENLRRDGADALTPDFFYVPLDQVRQVLDTILNFAPIPELASVVDEKDIDPRFATELKAIIAARALSHEDFDGARKMMSAEQFALGAAKLEGLSAKVKATKSDEEKARFEARLGDAWAALRGNLLPLKGLPAQFGDEKELEEINRRINGKAMGYREVEKELDERDELRHASRLWLRAARRIPATPLSVACRVKALEAIAKVAGKSDYAFQRAMEDDMAKASREIYEKLQAESPRAALAKQAAYWSFIRPQNSAEYTDKAGFSGAFFSDRWYEADMRRRSGYYWDNYELSGQLIDESDYGRRNSKGWDELGKRIPALRNTTKTVPELGKEVGELRGIATSHFCSVSQAACLNFLEDLVHFLGEPKITDEIAHRYINLRLDVLTASSWHGAPIVPELIGIARSSEDYSFSGINAQIQERIGSAFADPIMQPAAEYLEFLEAAMIANIQVSIPLPDRKKSNKDDETTDEKEDGGWNSSRDYPLLEKKLRAFLGHHPQSRKREAARLLLARAVYRQSWPQISVTQRHDAEPVTRTIAWEALKPNRVLAEMDAYDREFPNGRYSPDIRNMRASVYWRSANWKPALELTVRQLDEQIPDLKRDAVLRLANIFAELGTPEQRPALLAALRENASAVAWLKVFLTHAPNYRDHPLRFLGKYLETQLGFTLKTSEEKQIP